jgi:hypothetical protein
LTSFSSKFASSFSVYPTGSTQKWLLRLNTAANLITYQPQSATFLFFIVPSQAHFKVFKVWVGPGMDLGVGGLVGIDVGGQIGLTDPHPHAHFQGRWKLQSICNI